MGRRSLSIRTLRLIRNWILSIEKSEALCEKKEAQHHHESCRDYLLPLPNLNFSFGSELPDVNPARSLLLSSLRLQYFFGYKMEFFLPK